MFTKGVVDPSKMPPTESAAIQHTLRVYYQCTVWKPLRDFSFDPCLWGWVIEEGVYTPLQSSQECAPSNLLQFIRCKCKNSCSSNLCSCKKHGLKCVFACKNCRGSCDNSEVDSIQFIYVSRILCCRV